MKRRPEERFWSKVDKAGDCWIWRAGLSGNGYGTFLLGGKQVTAHRAAWILTWGSAPKDKDICHTCDNRSCVRPDHLFEGTRMENIRDSVRKGRFNQTKKTAFIGEGNPRAKLQAKDVLSIRSLWATGRWTLQELAKKFSVSTRSIWKAANGVSFQST